MKQNDCRRVLSQWSDENVRDERMPRTSPPDPFVSSFGMCSRKYEQMPFDELPEDHKTNPNVDLLPVIPKASH